MGQLSMKKIFITFASVVLAFLFVTYYFLTTLTPDDLLIGATSDEAFKVPPKVFQLYIRYKEPIPANYHTDTGLPAIQFVANGRGLDKKKDSDCILMIKYLLRIGADINIPSKDKLGFTVMHTAVLSRDLELIKFLLSHGGNPNALVVGERYKGMTPIRFLKELSKSKDDPRLTAIEKTLRENGGLE